MELEPWILILGEAPETSLATWSPDGLASPAIALFSTRAKAEHYAERHCPDAFSSVQLQRPELLQVLIDAYRNEMRHAVLDPSASQAGQLFQLDQVLKAAKEELRNQSLDS